MAEREFLSILDRLFRQRAKSPIPHGGRETRRSKTEEPARIERAKKDAEEWAQKAFSKDPDIKAVAKDRIVREKYPADVLTTAKTRWEAAAPVVLENAPSWLHAESIHQSSVASEFALRITSLPPELQRDANVLFYEAAKCYWSTDWGSLGTEEVREVRQLLGRVIDEARHVSDQNINKDDRILIEQLFGEPETKHILVNDELDKGPTFFDKDTAKGLNADLIIKLDAIQKQVNISPEAWDTDQQFLDNLLNKQVKGSLLHNIDETDTRLQNDIKPYIRRIVEQRAHVGEALLGKQKTKDFQGREFSTIYLQEKEEKKLRINLRWEIEKYARRVEETSVLYPDTPVAQAAQDRLRLVSAYVSHDQFQIDVRSRENLTELGFEPDLHVTNPERDKYLEFMRNVPNEISEKISNRSNIQIAYAATRAFGDPEQIQKATIAVGTKGLGFLVRENGSLVDITVNKLNYVRDQFYRDSEGEKRRYTPQVLETIEKQVVEEMYEDRALYEELYAKAFSVPGLKGEKHKLDRKAIESIVRLAGYHDALTERSLVAQLRGLGPGETNGDESSYLSAGTDDKILGVMDINRWFFEKWGNLKDGQLFIWRASCRMATKISGRDKVANKKFAEISRLPTGKERIDRIAQAFGINPEDAQKASGGDAAKRGEIERKLQKELRFSHGGKERRDIPKTLDQISDKDLKDRLLVVEGERVLGELLAMYDHYSSSWRVGTYINQINSIWGKEKGGVLGLGFRLRSAGAKVVDALTIADKKAAIGIPDPDQKGRFTGLKGTLQTIAEYRPQALFEYLSDEGHPATKIWFADKQILTNSVFLNNTDKDGYLIPIQNEAQIQKLIGRPFIAINELLTEKGLPPIDYSTGASTGDQAEIVATVCKEMNINKDKYIELMKEMSAHVGHEDIIDMLATNERYSWIYTRTRWIDDARLRYLEHPESVPGEIPSIEEIKQENSNLIVGNERISLSKRFTVEGVGAGDPLPRTWSDTNIGVKTIPELYAVLTADEKTYFEKLKIIFDNIALYQGSKPVATRSILYLMAGWAESAKTTKNIGDILMSFLHSKQSTSALQELFGHQASSKGLNELEEFIDTHGTVLGTRLKLMVPKEMFETVEEFLGLASHFIDIGPVKFGPKGKWPLYRNRVLLVMAVVSVLIAMDVDKRITGSAGGRSQ
jgi:hypothetical protein